MKNVFALRLSAAAVLACAVLGLEASAGPSNVGAPDGTLTLRPAQVAPLPRQVYPALAYRESAKGDFRLRLGRKGSRPQILEHVSGNRYRQVPWKSVRIDWNAPESALFCWNTIISGGERCYENLSALRRLRPTQLARRGGETDLLEYARWAKQEYGMRIARDLLFHKVAELDASDGELENRVLKTTKNRRYAYDDSMGKLPLARRGRVGLLIVYGIDTTGNSKNRVLMQTAARSAEERGFYVRILDSHPYGTADHNAELLAAQIQEHARNVDQLVLIAASKGVGDLLRALVTRREELMRGFPRDKLKLLIGLSGVARESFVADWIVDRNLPIPFLLRTFLRTKRGNFLAGMRSLAEGPWDGRPASELGRAYPSLKWLSLSMFPEGGDGFVHVSGMADFMRDAVTRHESLISPSDGLVETAATFLPPGSGVPQYIVRGFGPHALALGRYRDGTPIAPQHQGARPPLNPEAGAEILDAFLRAMPASLLD